MNALARFLRRIPTLGAALVVIGALLAGVFVGVRALPASAAGAPTTTSIAPTFGVLTGGTAATITGTGFVGGATVTFDGVAATAVVVASVTSITATTPAGTPGKPVIVVTNPDGQGATLTNAYTYLGPPPTLTSVAPASGSTNGDAAITLMGTNFAAGMTVTVGAGAATGVVVASPTLATAVTPTGAAGAAVGVVVTNADTQTATLAASFTYILAAPPTISSVSPTSGTHVGGTVVTITGAAFANNATVKFGTTAATGVTWLNATTITAVAPAGTAATTVAVTVTNPDSQSGTLSSAYGYVNTPPPTITSISPSRATLSGGVTVTIAGTGFVTGAMVKFGSVVVAPSSVTATSIAVVAPAGTASVAVIVTNPDLDTATLANGFKYVGAPTIKSVSPLKVASIGGATLTITGTGFETGATVTVGGVAATSATFVSATQITAIAPPGTVGSLTAVAQNTDLQQGTLLAAVQYVLAPHVTSVTPGTGPAGGGTLVTIVGENFATGTTVKFGDAKSATVVMIDAQVLTAVTPAGKDTVTVAAFDLDGVSAGGVAYLYEPAVVVVTPTATPSASPTATPTPTSGPRFTLGEVPKQGFGTVAFSGGKSVDLVAASSAAGCVAATSAYFVFVNGTFFVYLPAAPAMVNVAWETHFAGAIPVGQLIVMRCVV